MTLFNYHWKNNKNVHRSWKKMQLLGKKQKQETLKWGNNQQNGWNSVKNSWNLVKFPEKWYQWYE